MYVCACFHLSPPPTRCAEVTLQLKLFGEQLSQVSDLLTQIDLPEDGAPITLEWMHTRQEEINLDRARVFSEKRLDTNKLAKHKEMVLSELEKLRGLNRHHRKLMVEVWPHLTSLARVRTLYRVLRRVAVGTSDKGPFKKGGNFSTM